MKLLAGKSRKFWVAVLAAVLAWPAAGAAGPPLTLQGVENRLVRGGYLDTLFAAHWAVRQGDAVVPLLAQMLEKGKQYEEEEGGAIGAYPFNVLWALAHIPSSKAQAVLDKYHAATKDPVAALALKGWWLRRHENSPRFGVLINESRLLERPQEKAQTVKKIKAGQKVKILQEMVANPREMGPRGGAAYYDRVELIPSAEQGFIPRGGDDFSPFM